jgi:hypothetical protein
MLVNEPLVPVFCRDPILIMLAGMDGTDPIPRQVRIGVWEVGHYGSSDFLRGLYEQYPENLSADPDAYLGPYGVCDDVGDILRVYPLLEADPARAFVVTMKRVKRNLANKGMGGGWRWHKWGEYIGTQQQTTEYLDDEPKVEQVYCFHIYEKL